MAGKQQTPDSLGAQLQVEADAIRPLYELPPALEGTLYGLGCSTAQLSVRTGVRLEDLQRLRREDCAVPYVGPPLDD